MSLRNYVQLKGPVRRPGSLPDNSGGCGGLGGREVRWVRPAPEGQRGGEASALGHPQSQQPRPTWLPPPPAPGEAAAPVTTMLCPQELPSEL